MKKIISLSLLLIISATSFSQPTKISPPFTKQDYLRKSQHQNKIGWTLVLGGAGTAGLLSVGVWVITKSFGAGAVTMAAGLLAIPASIPFFIAAGRNKKKGMSLSIRNETAPRLQNSSFIYRAVPSVTLKIHL